ncbi:hypothetical protein AB7M35_000877 [Amorphus suaedae]
MVKRSHSFATATRLLTLTLIAAGTAACNTSSSYFYEEKQPSQQRDVGLFGGILESTGMVNRPATEIDYKQRSPIALPPTNELPPPEPEGGKAIAAVDWPNDPDKAAASEPVPSASSTLNGERLTPEEIQAGRVAGGMPTTNGSLSYDKRFLRDTGNVALSPTEMKAGFSSPDGKNSGKVLTAEGAAKPRQYLIQPPDEYRQPAETAELPQKKEIKNSKWARKQLYGGQEKSNPVYDTVN